MDREGAKIHEGAKYEAFPPSRFRRRRFAFFAPVCSRLLGSPALTLTNAGARLNTNTELRYYPYGVARYTAGTTPTTFNPSTTLRAGFTGQRKDSGSGLLFYNARW